MPYLARKERPSCIPVVKEFNRHNHKGRSYATVLDYTVIATGKWSRGHGVHHYLRTYRNFLSGNGQAIRQCLADAPRTYEGHHCQRNQVEERKFMSILETVFGLCLLVIFLAMVQTFNAVLAKHIAVQEQQLTAVTRHYRDAWNTRL